MLSRSTGELIAVPEITLLPLMRHLGRLGLDRDVALMGISCRVWFGKPEVFGTKVTVRPKIKTQLVVNLTLT